MVGRTSPKVRFAHTHLINRAFRGSPSTTYAGRIDNTRCVFASLIPLLRCPYCAATPLVLRDSSPNDRERVQAGTLACSVCARTTEIADFIWRAMGAAKPQKTLAQLSNVLPPVPQLYENVWRKRSLSLLTKGRYTTAEELEELRAYVSETSETREHVYLDVACSEGLYARTVAPNVRAVFAVDHSLPFLKRVVHRAGELPVVAVQALAQQLPFVSNAFHATIIGASLNEIGDQRAAVREMGRVSKPSARIFSMSLIPATTTLGKFAQAAAGLGGVTFPSEKYTIRLFEEAEIDVVQTSSTGVVLRLCGSKRENKTKITR
jgi:SAM-dependent methyltransferase